MKAKNIIVSTIIILLIISVAYVIYNHSQTAQSGNLEYTFGKCEGKKPNSIELSQEGSSIKFTQVLNTYCESEKETTLKYTQVENNIEIREVFSPSNGIAKCICPLVIEGKINNLQKGEYNIRFVHQVEFGEEKLLEEKKFELK